MIKSLGNESDMAWAIGGDFNDILNTHEKRGGNPSNFLSIKDFREALDHHNLRDVHYKGHPFTWSNGRVNGFIEERLDRVVANPVWHDMFKDAVVDTIIWDSSGHYPICVHFGQSPKSKFRYFPSFKKIFRFEAKWGQVDNFDHILNDFWAASHELGFSSWTSKVKHCGNLLPKWDKETFKRSQWRIAWLKRRMKRLRTLP